MNLLRHNRKQRRHRAVGPGWKVANGALFWLVLSVVTINAQEPAPVKQPSAPPPAREITKDDRARIDAAKDAKGRLRITLELTEVHLARAETTTTNEEFEAASAALGKYRAVMEDAMAFLTKEPRDTNKTRDLYKRLELALRAHGPRLLAIRRSTPLEYAVWVKELEEFARQGRTDALNSFYGTTVLKEPQSKVADDKRSKNPKDSEPNP